MKDRTEVGDKPQTFVSETIPASQFEDVPMAEESSQQLPGAMDDGQSEVDDLPKNQRFGDFIRHFIERFASKNTDNTDEEESQDERDTLGTKEEAAAASAAAQKQLR